MESNVIFGNSIRDRCYGQDVVSAERRHIVTERRNKIAESVYKLCERMDRIVIMNIILMNRLY